MTFFEMCVRRVSESKLIGAEKSVSGHRLFFFLHTLGVRCYGRESERESGVWMTDDEKKSKPEYKAQSYSYFKNLKHSMAMR